MRPNRGSIPWPFSVGMALQPTEPHWPGHKPRNLSGLTNKIYVSHIIYLAHVGRWWRLECSTPHLHSVAKKTQDPQSFRCIMWNMETSRLLWGGKKGGTSVPQLESDASHFLHKPLARSNHMTSTLLNRGWKKQRSSGIFDEYRLYHSGPITIPLRARIYWYSQLSTIVSGLCVH